jgi:hypothetical protein
MHEVTIGMDGKSFAVDRRAFAADRRTFAEPLGIKSAWRAKSAFVFRKFRQPHTPDFY